MAAKLSLRVSPLYPNALVGNTAKAQLTNLLICFTGTVECNGEYTASTFNANTSKFGSTSYIYVFANESANTLLQQVEFHTSCSKPLNLGDQYASSTLVGYKSERGEAKVPDFKRDKDADNPGDAVNTCPGDTLVFTYIVTNPTNGETTASNPLMLC